MHMGSNEVRLVERYLDEQKRAIDATASGDKEEAMKAQAVCRGIIIGYELYACEKFTRQLTKYHEYSRDDE